MMTSRMTTFLVQFCLLIGRTIAWTSYQPPYQPLYLPGPQFCPDTGMTVCTAVDYYPTDQIFHLLMNSRSQGFNLTSLFVDERKGDPEPNIVQLPTPKPRYQNGYDGNQPPPGGRFSPAGYNTGYGNYPSNDQSSSIAPELETDRWRQVSADNNNNNNNQGLRGTYVPGSRRQSRVQSNSRSYPPDPTATERFNYNDRSLSTNPQVNNNNGYESYGVNSQSTQSVNAGQFGGSNYSGYYPAQFPPQNPSQGQYGVKGQRTSSAGTWKGSSVRNSQTRFGDSQDNSQPYISRKRKRRNEDVEAACQVRTTYLPPRAALNDNSEWKYIVNVPERDRRFTQVVKVDICLNAGDPCSSRLSLPFGFESRCRQKYIKKKLLSLNPDGQGTSEDNFFIPSCCVCEIVRPSK